jgi:hypothetical protein
MLRRASPRRPPPPGESQPPGESEQAPEPAPGVPAGVIDETDDAGGHRIYLNPWADQDEPDEELPGPSARPNRLSTPIATATTARCRRAGSGGGRVGSSPRGCVPRPPGG